MPTTATQYETVIGLEVHAQLLTRSKMFCSCPSSYTESSPNTHVCPVCLGMPGVLPVINRRAVEMTIMTGLAFNCQIAERAKFDRKNYHYPDLMKGYQISEYDEPLCKGGWMDVHVDGQTKRIGITRIHLEEDTARLIHVKDPSGETYSLVDVNRSGVPLMEVVSEPDIRSAEEARAFLQNLRHVLRWIGASRANMEEGNMRCEPNVSVRPRGQAEFGAKVELKNINSFKYAYDAIKFEVNRQIQVLESGGRVVQETRGWREDIGQSVSQRTKEYADDYRYFPEPDLPPILIDSAWLGRIRAEMPELPGAMRARFQAQFGLSEYDAVLLTESRPRAEYFQAALQPTPEPDRPKRAKAIANWINSELAGLLNARNMDINEVKITPDALSQMIDLQDEGTISGKTAKSVFEKMFETGRPPRDIVEEAGLVQITAGDEIEAAIDRVLEDHAKAGDDYRRGKEEALKFLVGQVMRETRGRANPAMVNQLLKEKLGDPP